MDRRTALKAGGAALIGLGAGGCATGNARRARTASMRRPIDLPPVRASWDRVIRTTVGLRPHRPSGFLLRAEKLDDKLLIQ